MAALLNRIIDIGGTTAHQVHKSVAGVLEDYVTGADVISSVLAEEAGQMLGWQSVGHWQGEAHIGSFVSPDVQAKGVGAALFAVTCEALRQAGVGRVNASIRADNVPGLRFYARMGFVDFAHDPEFALRDGRVVGRVHRYFDVV